MDKATRANINSFRGKLVTVVMAGAVCQARALAEHRGGIWDVPAIWCCVCGSGIYRFNCNNILLPSGTTRGMGDATGDGNDVRGGSREPDRPLDPRHSDGFRLCWYVCRVQCGGFRTL